MRKSGKCEYTIGVNTRKKNKFLRPEEAVTEANRLNELPNVVKKFIAYKCTTCNFFHVGRSTEDNKQPTFKIFDSENITNVIKVQEEKIKEPIIAEHDDFDWNNKNKYI